MQAVKVLKDGARATMKDPTLAAIALLSVAIPAVLLGLGAKTYFDAAFSLKASPVFLIAAPLGAYYATAIWFYAAATLASARILRRAGKRTQSLLRRMPAIVAYALLAATMTLFFQEIRTRGSSNVPRFIADVGELTWETASLYVPLLLAGTKLGPLECLQQSASNASQHVTMSLLVGFGTRVIRFIALAVAAAAGAVLASQDLGLPASILAGLVIYVVLNAVVFSFKTSYAATTWLAITRPTKAQ